MRTGFRKLAAMCAAVVALVGAGSGTARAVITNPPQMNSSESAPLYLEHGSSMLSQDGTGTCSEHYSHSSHVSHESHYSHYSGR
jgi:hypothetical protein